MEIIRNLDNVSMEKKTALAIGKFDGLHRGHRFLLAQVLEQKSQGLAACAFTFHPTPSVYFGFGDGRELSTIEEKRLLFSRIGLDYLIEFPMNTVTAAIEPEEFVEEILVRSLNVGLVVAGGDLSFGVKGRGDILLLQKMGERHGFSVQSIDKVRYGGREISSTLIRALVEEGDLLLAGELLGMPYTLPGHIIGDDHGGMGLRPVEGKLLPPAGRYSALIRHEKEAYPATVKIGLDAGGEREIRIYPLSQELTVAPMLVIIPLDVTKS